MKQNRIILISSSYQILVFSASCSSWGWGDGWMGVGGGWGVPPHMCTCTSTHGKHGNFMQMAAFIGFGEIPGIPYDVICACMPMCMHARARACVHMCVYMGGVHPLTTPHPHPPTPHPPGGDPWNHSKFKST